MTGIFAISHPRNPCCRSISDSATLATPPPACQQRPQQRHAVTCAAAPRTSLGPMVRPAFTLSLKQLHLGVLTLIALNAATTSQIICKIDASDTLQADHAADDLLDELPGSDAFAELVRLAVAADPSLADSTAAHGASPPSPASDAKKPAWLRQRAPQGVSCNVGVPDARCT